MQSILKIAALGIACLVVTGVCLMIMNSIISIFAPCYVSSGCPKMPMTETIATALDAVRYILYFGIFPLATIIRRRDFRKLTSSKNLNRTIRYALAALPVLLLPFRTFLNVNLF